MLYKFSLGLMTLSIFSFSAYAEEQSSDSLDEINVTAEEQVKQSLGASKITAQDLERNPVENDVAEIVSKMPGVTLSSNSPTGNRGNKRQIDIRAMGPENTLILIDGKPVKSRNAERYTRNGERNSRGDSNWIPPEEIDSIEVLRGPSAARYGSGAMGGVVNIKTKSITEKLRGSLTYFTEQPENRDEGATNRVGVNLSGPIIKNVLGFRLYGSWNKTDADAMDINQDANNGLWYNAGREGVRNKDFGARLQWNVTKDQKLTFDFNYGRQGNIYNGDTQGSSGGGFVDTNAFNTRDITTALANSNAETARLYQQNYVLTHEGNWSWGGNKTYFQYSRTTNSRLPESLFASSEGSYRALDDFVSSELRSYRFSNELYIPFRLGVENMLTFGIEAERTTLDDPSSMAQSMANLNFGMIPGLADQGRSGKIAQNDYAVFLENNMLLSNRTILVPGIRFDYSSKSGSNWSPSLNLSHNLDEHWTFKAGIARAYKTPNLYQLQPNYLTASGLRGCPLDPINNNINSPTANDPVNPTWGRSCYFRGNPDLKPETSWNKEIGFEYSNDGYLFSLAYFHNDYRNKVVAEGQYDGTAYMPNDVLNANVRKEDWPDPWNNGMFDRNGDGVLESSRIYRTTTIYRWGNAKKALVEGFEGNVTLPFLQGRLTANTNFTYFRRSINKDTGNPLSIVPKYTVNTSLNYQINEQWDINASYTRYGKQLTKSNPVIWGDVNRLTGKSAVSQYKLGSYGIWNMNIGYKWNDSFSIRIGVNNLLNKRILRTSSSSARTYNEHGRAYYASLKYSF
ncbi:FepA family TonB-dependent siderophore receptor [Pasteurellaceae bacterium LIM206]|nr:FepA family TonB-dependent siderophore receptor [Pasteurellaceae bacterium LIM206]